MRQAGTRKQKPQQEQELAGQARHKIITTILVSLASVLLVTVLVLVIKNYAFPSSQPGENTSTPQAEFNFSPPSALEASTGELAAAPSIAETKNTAASSTNELEVEASSKVSSQELSPQDKQVQAELIQAHIKQNFDSSQLVSQTYCLMDLETGLVLAEEKADQAFPPASLTKVLTALLALNHYSDLNEEVIIQDGDVAGLVEADASTAGFQAGQTVTIEDLLHGLLLPSGADAAHALAREISGGQAAFVRAMNDKAQDLGLKHSHFTNPTGLPEDGLYSTAQDMAQLFWTACQDERFVKIAGSDSYGMAPDDFYPDGLGMLSTFIWKFNSDPDFSTTILAGKSGYTGTEQCQASLFEKNGRRYILTTLGAITEDPSSASAVHDQVVIMNELVK